VTVPYTLSPGGISSIGTTNIPANVNPSPPSRDIAGTYRERIPGATAQNDRVTYQGSTYQQSSFADKQVFMTPPDSSGNRNVLYIEDDGTVTEYRIDSNNRIITAWRDVGGQRRQDSSANQEDIRTALRGEIEPAATPSEVATGRPEADSGSGAASSTEARTPGRTLTEAEQTLLRDTELKDLTAWVDDEGNLHIDKTADLEITDFHGTSESVEKGDLIGDALPRSFMNDLATALAADPDGARFSKVGDEHYRIEFTRQQKGFFFTDTVKKTIDYPVVPDDILSDAGYVYARRERTVIEEGGPGGETIYQERTTYNEERRIGTGTNAVTVQIPRRESTTIFTDTDSQGRQLPSGQSRAIGEISVDHVTRNEVVEREQGELTRLRNARPPDREAIKEKEDEIKALENKPATYTELARTTEIRRNGEIVLGVDEAGDYFRVNEDGEKVIVGGDAEAEAYLRRQGISEEEAALLKEQADATQLNTRRASWGGYYDLASWDRLVGDFFRNYDQFSGFAQLSSLFIGDFIEENRARLAQSFCGFAGIDNCLVSAICGQIHKFEADNVLIGRTGRAEYKNSAVINAERSEPILLAGLSAQQLIDILGNQSVVGGRRVDLTDPTFDPTILGPLTLRLYHVQYSITNNLESDKLRFNVELRRTSASAQLALAAATAASVQAQMNRTSLGPLTLEDLNQSTAIGRYVRPVRTRVNGLPALSSVRLYPQDRLLDPGDTDFNHFYNQSTNEYDTACLTFNPGLPSGDAFYSGTVRELCVPFSDYTGGPTTLVIPQNQTG